MVSVLLFTACAFTYRPWRKGPGSQSVPVFSEALRVADNVHRTGAFANPFGTLPTGYTGFVAPGFPGFVAYLFDLFGEGRAGWIALSCVPAAALGLQLALLPWVCRSFGYSPWIGVLGALFLLRIKPASTEQWEAHLAGLLVVILCALVSMWFHRPHRTGLAWIVGSVAGIAMCIQPVVVLVYAGWMLFAWLRAGVPARRIAPLWIAPVLICAPWMVRNQIRLGTPAMRDELGLELRVSFNDCAPYGFEQSQEQGCFGQFHPNQNLAEAQAVRRLGEVPYFGDRMRGAADWIAHHPGRSLQLVAGRTWFFWFPSIHRWPPFLRNPTQSRTVWALTLLSFGGLWLSFKRRVSGSAFLGILAASFPLIYYVVQFDPRYRYPILWVTGVEAAYCCAFLWERAAIYIAMLEPAQWSPRFMPSPARWPSWVVPALLALYGIVYSMAYLKLPSRWWFEDDPSVFGVAGKISNPIGIFTDPQIVREFSDGRALVPIQTLSFWVDMHLAGASPRFAYGHQIASFLTTLLLLYFVLLPLFRHRKGASVSVCVLWTLLPATAAVLQFLTTRHYLEGLLFLLLCIFSLQRLPNPPDSAPPVRAGIRSQDRGLFALARAAAILAACLAMLSKETYATVTPVILLAFAWRYRDGALAKLTAGLIGSFAAYRLWLIGPSLDYHMPTLNAGQYLRFFTKLPYTLTAGYSGYWLFAIIAGLSFYYMHRRRSEYRALILFVALLLVSIATILPVSYSLYGTIRRPDPWYRIVFLVDTIALCGGGYFAIRSTRRGTQIALAAVALVALAPGAEKTRRLWVHMTGSAQREAEFYLSNPDKVLLSDLEGYWFIPGVNAMYKVESPHYTLSKDLASLRPKAGSTVWRLQDGRFAPEVIE
jgi:hypothetical protein